MSTATQSSSSDSRRYVDYDEFIEFQVQKTRAGIKSNDLLTALIGAAAALLAYVLLFAVFDHWVIDGGFSRPVRIILLSVLLVGLSVWFVWKLAIPYFRRVSALYAAQEIEQTEPSFRSTLLTLVDLKRSGRTVSPEIRAVLEKRAGLTLTHMNIERAVDKRLLMRLSYVLLALVVITCLYTVLSPKKLSNSLWRSLVPTSSVAVDTRTRIEKVDPGDVDVLARSQLPVTVELSGVTPDEVTLLYTTIDNRFVDEPITMRETEDGIRQYRGIITGENGRGILQSLSYRIVAGDAHSKIYQVTVSQPPSAEVDEVEYHYPDYMGFQDRVQVGGGIDAWEGTWVTIRATANMPVKSALVKFSDTDDISQKAEEVPVEIENGTLLTARWQLQIRSDGTYPNFYRIQCRNEAGKTDPSPTLYPIKIRPDQPPQIQLAQPTSDIERPANAVVPLLFAAQDPDFLLRSIVLRFERNGESLPRAPRLYEGPPYRKSTTGTYDLDLGSLELEAGDRLTYWLEARDNMEPFGNRSGNRSNTPKLNITITEPASPEEVQQQLEEDRQQVEERLDEAQQEPGEGAEPTPAEPNGEADAPPPSNEDESGEKSAEPEAGEQTNQPGQSEETEETRSQPGQGSSETSDGGQRQEGGSADEQGGQGAKQQQPDPNQSEEQGSEEVPFDDLLKRLMQQEQQPSEQGDQPDQPGDPQSQQSPQAQDRSQDGERQRSADDPQSAGQESGTGEQKQSGESESASPDSENQNGSPSPSSSPNGETPPSPADATQQSPGEATQPDQAGENQTGSSQPGEGTESAPDVTDPNVREGKTEGGQPSSDQTPTASERKNQTDTPGTEGARREPADESQNADPTTSRKGDPTNPENRQPAAEGTEGEPMPSTNPPSPRNDEPSPRPDTPAGQPEGARQSPSESGNSSGQSQPGEPGRSQPSSAGQSGDRQQQPGDSASPSGQNGQSDQKGGQSSNGTPQGSESSPMNGQSGSESSSPSEGSQQDGTQPRGTQPQGGEPSSADGNDGPTDPSPTTGEQPKGQGDSPQSDQQQGGDQSSQQNQPQGGQPDSGGQENSGGGQQDAGSPSEGQQSGGGSQPGGDPSSGGPPGGQQGGQPGQQGNQGGTPSNVGGGSGATGNDQGPDASPADGAAGGGNRAGQGAGEGEGGVADDIQAEAPDLEAKRKAAELVLKRLEDQLQRGEISPELQEELGVNEDQLRDFTERLRQRLADTGEDTSPEAEARRRQFERSLRDLNFDSTGTERAGGDGPRKASGGFGGTQRTAPAGKGDAVQKYRQLLNQQSSGRRNSN